MPDRPARQSVSADARVPNELIVRRHQPPYSVHHRGMAQGPSSPDLKEESVTASQKQRRAAKKNIKKAIKAAKRKQTLKHLPKKTRQALDKQAAKVRQSRK
jgi:hypothetical protein